MLNREGRQKKIIEEIIKTEFSYQKSLQVIAYAEPNLKSNIKDGKFSVDEKIVNLFTAAREVQNISQLLTIRSDQFLKYDIAFRDQGILPTFTIFDCFEYFSDLLDV
jgi:hypothetical protein